MAVDRSGMSRTRFRNALLAAAACVATSGVAGAGTVQFQLGEQDFADGRAPVLSSEIRAAGAGEPFPFDGSIFGNDVRPALGSFTFAHAFDLRGAAPLAAVLTIGLIDAAALAVAAGATPIDTVALWFDGVAQPAGPFAGVSAMGTPSSAEVVDVRVPIELLADGSLTVTVSAIRPGAGNVGNAIEADFARLTIQTDREPAGPVEPVPDHTAPPPDNGGGGGGDGGGGGGGGGPVPVPVPAMLWPAGLLLAGVVAFPKRLLRRWLGL